MYANSAALNIYSPASPIYDPYIKGRKQAKKRPPADNAAEGALRPHALNRRASRADHLSYDGLNA